MTLAIHEKREAMKILVFANSYGLGGGTTHFQLLTQFMVREGHQVFAVGLGDQDEVLPSSEGLAGLERLPHTARSPLDKLKKGLAYLRIQRKAAAFDPDLFFCIGYGNSYIRMARHLKGRAFSFFQDLIYGPTPGDPLITGLVGVFDAVAVQSPAMVEPFLKGIPTGKPVRCLPCFGHPPVPGYLAKPPASGQPVRLGYFGRLTWNKGVVPFVRALGSVRDRVHATLDIYGSGPETGKIEEAIAELDLGDLVKVRGSYPGGAGYAGLLSQCHGLVLPSIGSEGIPLVLLESMSYGVPFLCTTTGAMADTAVNNPDVMVVKPTEEALAEGVVRFCEGLNEGRMDNVRLQNYYQQHFSHGAIAAVWREMLAGPKGFFEAARRPTRG